MSMVTSQDLLDKAIIIAAMAHNGQKDKGGSNYILHPLRVMASLDTLEEKIVGALHDVIDDTYVTYKFLKEEGFPDAIIESIELLTKRKNESYFDYINRIKENDIACKVKLADLNDNLNIERITNPSEMDYKRLEKYKKAKKLLVK